MYVLANAQSKPSESHFLKLVIFSIVALHHITGWDCFEAQSSTHSRCRNAHPWGSCFMLTISKIPHANSQRVSQQLVYYKCVIKSALGNCFVQPYLT